MIRPYGLVYILPLAESQLSSRDVIDSIALAAATTVLALLVPWELVFSATAPTGGDTSGHYSAFVYFNDHILPNLRLWGWNQGNLAGFSQFEFYFPLPFLIFSALGLIFPLPIAYKIGVLLPAFALPFCTYLSLRLLRAHFPGAIVAAVFSLSFLFVENHSVWGGNIGSLLAGEVCYGYGFCLTWVYLGMATWWLKGRSGVVAPSLMLMAVGLCHASSLLFCLLAGVFAVGIRRDWRRAAVRLLVLYVLSFLLLGFWLIPFITSGAQSDLFNFIWIVDDWHKYLPPLMWPLFLLAPAGLLLSYFMGDLNDKFRANYLVGWLAAAGVLLLISPLINAVTVRFVPFIQFTGLIITACGIGVALKNQRARWLAAVVIIAVALAWPCAKVKNLPVWLHHNNSGSEAMTLWPDMARMNEILKGQTGDSRIIFEHVSHNDRYGSDRSLEALSHWTGRPTLGGLHIQASPNSPFLFYLRSEISTYCPTPLPLYHHTHLNLARALRHLALYNVGHFIAMDRGTVQAALATPGLKPSGEFGPFHVFTVEGCPDTYATPPECGPVAVVTERPRFIALQWFRFTNLKTPLVFFNSDDDIPAGRFASVLHDDGTRASPILKILRDDGLPCRAMGGHAAISEKIGPQTIELQGLIPGQPVLISISFDRGWRSTSGEAVYEASPAFMLIYPTGTSLKLVHGPTWPHWLGLALTICGGLLGLFIAARPLGLEQPLGRISDFIGRPPLKRRLVALALILVVAGVSWLWLVHDDPRTLCDKAKRAAEEGRREQARGLYSEILAEYGMCDVGDHCLSGMAMTHYSEGDYERAITLWLQLLRDYPDSSLLPETLYHLARSYENNGDPQKAGQYGRELVRLFPNSDWAAKWTSGK